MDPLLELRILNSGHHFIYGDKTKDRELFLKELEYFYSLELDGAIPRAYVVYVPHIGLPSMDIKEGISKSLIELVSKEYVIYSIASSLVEKILDSDDYDEIAYRSKNLLFKLNNCYLQNNDIKVRSYSELLTLFSRIKETLKKHYESYCKDGVCKSPIITPFDLIVFLENLKDVINNVARPVIMLDHQETLNITGYQTINSLIYDICPSLASINVVTAFDDWATYYTLAGEMINYNDNYEVLDLDGNFARAQEAIAKKYSIDGLL